MVLSSAEIQRAILEKRLVIDPVPLPLKQELGGQKCPYNTHSVDLTLGCALSIPRPETAAYDLTAKNGSLAKFIAAHSEHVTITHLQPFKLEPHTFILAQTREKIDLPLTSSLAARIEGKSSIARCGILIHFTAPTVHPGFRGPLTLEMINLGNLSFMLSPGMPIAQLIIEEVKGDLVPNPSQFQDQSTPEGLS